jgi:hypothetical protein
MFCFAVGSTHGIISDEMPFLSGIVELQELDRIIGGLNNITAG